MEGIGKGEYFRNGEVCKLKEGKHYKIVHAGNLACVVIDEPIIKPLGHLGIPKDRVDCCKSSLRNCREPFCSRIIPNKSCKEGYVEFHLGKRKIIAL